MEPKNRLVIVLAVTVLIIGAILTSFGRSIFSLHTPEVILPSGGEQASSSQQQHNAGNGRFQPVEVSTKTVQDVIATLDRDLSFFRELTIETFWNDRSSLSHVENWTDGDWSHSRQILPSGAIRHELIGGGQLYYWYEGSSRYLTAEAWENSADLSQRIPTYETVLQQDPKHIIDAGYEMQGDYPCVYAEVQDPELDILTRFWVSVDNGLLIAAEQIHSGKLVYRMTGYGTVQSPCPAEASFELPDGTVLHQAS